MVIVRLAALALLGAALAACSTGDCDQLESCDIRERSCQERVAKVVACLRGSRSVMPRVAVVDADDFIDERVSDADETPLDDDQRAHYRALHLFRLMPADLRAGELAQDEWAEVAAFFDSDTHRVTVLDRGYELDGAGSVLLLAHELVHAQQSRETDDAFYPAADDTRDAGWAANAMIEGEATLYQDLADVFAYGFEPGDLDWRKIYLGFESSSWIYASRERSIYARVDSSFSYAFGAAYLSEAYRKGGVAAVRKAVRDVPASTREVSAGYPRHPDRFEIESLEEVAIPMLPEGYVFLSSERAGGYLFESLLVRAEARLRAIPDLVGTGVTGDSLSTFRVGDDQAAVFWRVRFEDEDHALFTESRLAKLDWGLVVKREERDVIVAAVSDDSRRGEIAGDLAWGPAPEPAVATLASDEPKQIRCAFRRLPAH